MRGYTIEEWCREMNSDALGIPFLARNVTRFEQMQVGINNFHRTAILVLVQALVQFYYPVSYIKIIIVYQLFNRDRQNQVWKLATH